MKINDDCMLSGLTIVALGYTGLRMAELANTSISISGDGRLPSSRSYNPVIDPKIVAIIGMVSGMAYGAASLYACKSPQDAGMAAMTAVASAFFGHIRYLPTYSRPGE